jgi:hypothetical protein
VNDYFLVNYCVLVMQTMHTFVNTIARCANDELFFSLTMELCRQVVVLNINFIKLEFMEFGCKKKLRFVEKRHYQPAVLANDLVQTFNKTVLEQLLLMSALPICIEGKNTFLSNLYARLTYISHFFFFFAM